MSDDERRVWLETYCEDLKNKTDAAIGEACRKYRQNAANKYFPTPGALLELMKNPYADPPTGGKYDLWARLGFGGGDCKCLKCMTKRPREGFFKAGLDDYRRAETVKAELDGWFQKQIPASRLNDAEMHTRFLMTQDLVRDHGWDWENARRKVMIDRTRGLYPEFKNWPVIPHYGRELYTLVP